MRRARRHLVAIPRRRVGQKDIDVRVEHQRALVDRRRIDSGGCWRLRNIRCTAGCQEPCGAGHDRGDGHGDQNSLSAAHSLLR